MCPVIDRERERESVVVVVGMVALKPNISIFCDCCTALFYSKQIFE